MSDLRAAGVPAVWLVVLSALLLISQCSSTRVAAGRGLHRRASSRRLTQDATGSSLVLEQILDVNAIDSSWTLPFDLPYLVDCWSVTNQLWDLLTTDQFAAVRPLITATEVANITCEYIDDDPVFGLRVVVPLVPAATREMVLSTVSEYDIIVAVSTAATGMACGSVVNLYFTSDETDGMTFTCQGGDTDAGPVPLPQLCCGPATPNFPPEPMAPSWPDSSSVDGEPSPSPSPSPPPVDCKPHRRRLRGSTTAGASSKQVHSMAVTHVIVRHPLVGRWGPQGIINTRGDTQRR